MSDVVYSVESVTFDPSSVPSPGGHLTVIFKLRASRTPLSTERCLLSYSLNIRGGCMDGVNQNAGTRYFPYSGAWRSDNTLEYAVSWGVVDMSPCCLTDYTHPECFQKGIGWHPEVTHYEVCATVSPG
jgi:hypothetical protein